MGRLLAIGLAVCILPVLFWLSACAAEQGTDQNDKPGEGVARPTDSAGSAHTAPVSESFGLLDPTSTAAPPHLAGITVTVLLPDSPSIASPVRQQAATFEERSGAHLAIHTVPFEQLYEEIQRDFLSVSNQYDVALFPSEWTADFAAPGYLAPLTAAVESDTQIAWNDMARFVRETSVRYEGTIVTIPLDGDVLLLYYRADLLQQAGLEPPRTWEDYIAIARFFHGRDLDSDGSSDFGSCVSRYGRVYDMLWAVAASFLQSQGTQQGAFFDPDSAAMQPLVENEAFAVALDTFKALMTYGPSGNTFLDEAAMRSLFLDGRCVLTIDDAAFGKQVLNPASSSITDTLGVAPAPGSRRVLDRATGKLVACDSERCPFALDGINNAPFAATGGWVGGVSADADPEARQGGYALLSFLSQPAPSQEAVMMPSSGFHPYRTSHCAATGPWVARAQQQAIDSGYCQALQQSLNNPNVALDLRIDKRQRYQQVIVAKVLTEFLNTMITREQAMQRISDGWARVTEQAGPETQRAVYRATLRGEE